MKLELVKYRLNYVNTMCMLHMVLQTLVSFWKWIESYSYFKTTVMPTKV